MTLIVVIAGKGSPGVTTTAAALAAVSTTLAIPTLLVELDPAGGSLALQTQRSLDPGLGTLMAGARRGLDGSIVDAHCQALANGANISFAPTNPEHARRAVTTLAPLLAEVLAHRPGLTVVDCGRWDGDDHLRPIIAAADRVLVLLRPSLSGTEAVRTRLPGLIDLNPNSAAICIGEQPYSASEVAAALGVPAERPLAFDPRAADLITTGASVDRWLRRTPFLRSATELLDRNLVRREVEASA